MKKITNRKMLEALKQTQDYDVKIRSILENIITNTFCEGHFDGNISYRIGDISINVQYNEIYYGDTYTLCCSIPLEWLDEGYDYVAAYKAMKQKEEEERLKQEAEARKAKAAAKSKDEYKTYLKLKKKYENT